MSKSDLFCLCKIEHANHFPKQPVEVQYGDKSRKPLSHPNKEE